MSCGKSAANALGRSTKPREWLEKHFVKENNGRLARKSSRYELEQRYVEPNWAFILLLNVSCALAQEFRHIYWAAGVK